MKLSIVVPCFNEEEALPIFYETCEKTVSKMPVEAEYWFVDDGSKDHTLAEIKKLQEKDERVHYISFSRNFGKEAGLLAGLSAAEGDLAVTMDVDLQDPPSLLPEMYRVIMEEGYDCCAARRSSRQGEPPVRSWFAHRFYHLINRMSDTEIVDGARDYRMMKRIMVDAIIHDKEYNRFSKGIYSWVGFRTKWLSYENIERSAGTVYITDSVPGNSFFLQHLLQRFLFPVLIRTINYIFTHCVLIIPRLPAALIQRFICGSIRIVISPCFFVSR